MRKSDKITYLQKDAGQLNKTLLDLDKQISEAKAKQQLGSLKDTSVFKKLRYEVALIKSILSTQHVSK